MESIYWVVSRDCNQRCSHCYNDSEPGAPGLTLAQASRCIEHLPAPGDVALDRIILSGGELLVWPELLFHTLNGLHARYGDAVKLLVQTNGDLLAEALLDRLLAHHVSRIDVSSMDKYHPKSTLDRFDYLQRLFESRGLTWALGLGPAADAKPGQPLYNFWGANEGTWIGPLRQLREQLRGELKELQRRTGVTTLFVTHDQEEALSLADRVGLMLNGRLLQVAAPRDLYERPRTPFVARFVGQANLFEVVEVTAATLQLRGGLQLPRAGLGPVAKGSWLLARPERLVVGAEAATCPLVWTGTLLEATFFGADQLLKVALAPEVSCCVRCRPDAVPDPRPHQPLQIGVPAGALWCIPESDPPWLAEMQRGTTHHADR